MTAVSHSKQNKQICFRIAVINYSVSAAGTGMAFWLTLGQQEETGERLFEKDMGGECSYRESGNQL